MRRYWVVLLLFVTLTAQNLFAQDHLYSQFYDAPIYLNPALNGQFDGDFRMNLIYRSQWTALPGPLNYYTLSADLNLPMYNSGIGLMITKSTEGTAYLDKINVSSIYSYHVEFENAQLSFGLQAGMTNRKVDEDKLVFLDQLGPGGIIPNGSSGSSALALNHRFFFDSGAGVNLVLGNVMVGLSGQHLNQPNESLTGGNSILPQRYNGYASYKIPLNPNFEDSPSIIPSVVFSTQAGVHTFSTGMQYKNGSLNIGLWYRGDGPQNDAMVLSLIFDIFGRDSGKTRFGISHDVTTSKINYSKTAGTTEGSLSYETKIPGWGEYEYKMNTNSNRCYSFY
jgi:type IX secretion system PorP/SprF family membrane protein